MESTVLLAFGAGAFLWACAIGAYRVVCWSRLWLLLLIPLMLMSALVAGLNDGWLSALSVGWLVTPGGLLGIALATVKMRVILDSAEGFQRRMSQEHPSDPKNP